MAGTIITTAGNAILANAAGLGTLVNLSAMAVGDGGGVAVDPTEATTALANEVYRAALNDIERVDDGEGNSVLAMTLVIPAAEGGWTVREAGVFTSDGVLFCVASIPASYKPLASEGATSELRIRLELTFTTRLENVVLKVDPTIVLATRSYVDSHATRRDNPHEVTAAQLPDLLAYLRGHAQATEALLGLLRIATDAEAQALTDNLTALTPAKLAAAFGGSNQLLNIIGYQQFPGGLIVQLTGLNATQAGAAVTWPLAFPTACLRVFAQNVSDGNTFGVAVRGASTTGATVVASGGTTVGTSLLAIGH